MSPRENRILIIDKHNFVGEAIARELTQSATVVLVCEKALKSEGNLVSVAFSHGVPKIPQGKYVHILLVWKNETKHFLDPLQKQVQENRGQLTLLVDEREVKEVQEKIRTYPWITCISVGDVFGSTIRSPLDIFLQQAKQTRKIHLVHMGLQQWYPVLFADVITKLCEILLFAKSKKTLFLGPAYPLTQLSIAHGLQRVDPDVTIDFLHHAPEAQKEAAARPSVFGNYPSIAKLQAYYQHLSSVKHEAPARAVFSSKNKKSFPLSAYVVYVFLIALVLPLVGALITLGAGFLLLKTSLAGVQSGNMRGIMQELSLAQQSFSFSQTSWGIVTSEAQLIGQGSTISYFQKQAKLGQEATGLVQSTLTAANSVKNILQGNLSSVQAQNEIGVVVSSVHAVTTQLQQISLQDVPKQYQPIFAKLQSLASLCSTVVDELPQLLGIGSEKSYLVLFQNNMELRPGGGFIGSYGLLKLKNGKIESFTIHDVYDADGQLQGHVEPPFAIRRYIPIVHLYLRDSNFDPSFIQNAKTAALLLSQETGDRVDGVVGVDVDTLKALLTSTGSVYVPSYNQTVTSQNFFTLIETHAQKNFFPGSTQKKDFLTAFGQALFEKLQQKGSIRMQELLSSTVQMILQKHIVVALADATLEQPFLLSDLSGGFEDVRASTSGSLNDFFGVVEANLGINKVNAFVTREISHQVVIDNEGNIQETATLILHNNSDGTWPGGVYRNYIRFIVPHGTVLQGVAMNGQEQRIVTAVTDFLTYEAKGFVAPVGLEVAREEENNKSLFGFLFKVQEKSSMTIVVTYVLPQAFLPQSPSVYNLSVWKQVGVEPYPYSFTFSIPQSLQILQANIPLDKQNHSHTLSLDSDKTISVQVSGK